MNPTCVKMLTSCPANNTPDHASQAQAHSGTNQNHRERQRPTFILRRQHQKYEHHAEDQRVQRAVSCV